LPALLILARCVLPLALGLLPALLSRRLRSGGLALPLARGGLLLPAALRCRGATTALPAAALRCRGATTLLPAAVRESTARCGPAAREAAAASMRGTTAGGSAASSTPPSLCIHLANEAQHEHARNDCRPDTTP
jgi:hypothetical protein